MNIPVWMLMNVQMVLTGVVRLAQTLLEVIHVPAMWGTIWQMTDKHVMVCP